MTGENAAPAEMPVASHGIASGETQPDLCSTAATQAPAAMPSVEEIRDLLCGYVPTLDASTEAARAILDLFAPILAEKELHHTTGERITRKDLNNAHRKGAEEGRLAAHLIDSVNSPLNACCYRDECRALEARALAAEAAVLAVSPYIDSIVCYASTIDTYDGNRVAKLVNEAAAAIRAQVNNEPGA